MIGMHLKSYNKVYAFINTSLFAVITIIKDCINLNFIKVD